MQVSFEEYLGEHPADAAHGDANTAA